MNPLAIAALTNNQRQLDIDGVEVGVSRQALDELLVAYNDMQGLKAAYAALKETFERMFHDSRKMRTEFIDALNEIAARDRQNFPPNGGSIASKAIRAMKVPAMTYDEPFRHVDRPTEYQRGLRDGIALAAEAANGVEPSLLDGMSERYVSIYCAARRDASDLIRAIPDEPCECCGDGKLTGLPGNACENCMNTGRAHPEFTT